MATHDFRAQESANKGKTYFLLAAMGLLTGLVAYAAHRARDRFHFVKIPLALIQSQPWFGRR